MIECSHQQPGLIKPKVDMMLQRLPKDGRVASVKYSSFNMAGDTLG